MLRIKKLTLPKGKGLSDLGKKAAGALVVSLIVEGINSLFSDADQVFLMIVEKLEKIRLVVTDGFKGRDVEVEARDRGRVAELEKKIADTRVELLRLQLGMTPMDSSSFMAVSDKKDELAKARDELEGVKARIQARRDAEKAGNTGDGESPSRSPATEAAAPLGEALSLLQKKLEEGLCPAIEGLTGKLGKVPDPGLMLGAFHRSGGIGGRAAADAFAGLPDSAGRFIDQAAMAQG